MNINSNYVLVEKIEEIKDDGFQLVKVEDISTYMGKVAGLPEVPIYVGNKPLELGDVVVFAKYSPNTHMVNRDGKELKYIYVVDLLEVL